MTVSTTTLKNSYAANGTTDTFSYTFKVFAASELTVLIRNDATGTETLKTLTTHYTVSGVGNAGGGTVTFTAGNIPATGETVVLLRDTSLQQLTDYQPADPFPAASHEDALDKLTHMVQEVQEEVDRSFKVSRTNSITTTQFTEGATTRANKLLSFDASGDLAVTQEIGTYKGDWSASTAYNVRDLVKDTSTNNIFICVTAHTSSGAQPLTTNTDSAKWSLIVDAASATTASTSAASSATAAAASATAAAASESASATSESNSASSASSASTSAANAASSQSAAASSASSASSSATSASNDLATFQGIFHGASASDPTTGLDAGDLYFNTTANALRVYNGSAWQDASGTLLGSMASQDADSVAITGGAITGITDLAVADGGTGSSTAGGARTSLGVAIGSDVQAYSADLDTYAANPLTSAELVQLQNIDGQAISASEWGYVATMQAVGTSDSPTFAAVNTGQGANELYAMNQDVETSDDVQFAKIGIDAAPTYQIDIQHSGGTADQYVRIADSTPTEFVGIFNSNTGGNAPAAGNATLKVRGMTTTNEAISVGGIIRVEGSGSSTGLKITSSTNDDFRIYGDGAGNVALNNLKSGNISIVGTITKPLQPAFLAYNSSTDASQTGNGAVATVEFDTEVFDQNADFNNSTDTFTAPIGGRYRFSIRLTVNGVAGAMNEAIVTLVTSNRSYRLAQVNPNNVSTGSGVNVVAECSQFADLDAADTAYVTVQITGGASDAAGIYGDGSNYLTMFCGELVA